MSERPLSMESPPPAGSSARSIVIWLGFGIAAVLALSVLASFAPAEFKKLFVFSTAFGGACGMVLTWLAREFDVRPRPELTCLCVLMALLGGINMGWVSYRQLVQVGEKWAREHPQDAAKLRMVERLAAADPETANSLATRRNLLNPTFADYLAFRVKGLGALAAPWPAVLWGVELALAAAAGGAVFHWRTAAASGTSSQVDSVTKDKD